MKTLKKLALSLVIGIMGVQTSFAVDMAGLGTVVAKDAGSALAGQVASSPGAKFGIRAGMNLASLSHSREGDYSNEYGKSSRTDNTAWLSGNLIGFHVGTVVDIKLLEFLYFQPGVMFSLKGANAEVKSESSYNYGGVTDTDSWQEKTTISAYYVDVPLNLSLKGTLAPNLALRTHVGPYVGFGLFGDLEYEYKEKQRDTEKEKIKLFEKDKEMDFALYNRFNMGIGFGVGIEISDFYIGVNYNYGLTSLATDDYNKLDGEKIYERTLGISLGYGF